MIIWIVVASSGKKKGTKAAGKAAGRAQRERGAALTKAAKAPRIPLFDKEESTKGKATAAEGEDPCHEDMLRAPYPSSVRYEETAQSAFEAAAEGDDPCHPTDRQEHETHARTVKEAEEVAAGTPMRSPAQEDLLRAVVMSEVLKRPAQRREERRLRRHHKAARRDKTAELCGQAGMTEET
ncbi:MAG: hypothetical protein IJ573_11340 [Clostridia bacterium]|nr:hypothetical protein [Clostridia bacterium]